MKRVEKILLLLGLIAFGLMLKAMSWETVLWALKAVGIGFALIFAQEMVSHVFNALGWWAAFLPQHRKIVPSFWRLVRLRIAGDGVHYLVPSAIVAGEVAKASMIGSQHSVSARVSSLVVSKFTQLLAFALVSAGSLSLILGKKVSVAAFGQGLAGALLLLAILIVALLAVAFRPSSKPSESPASLSNWRSALKLVDQDTRTFIRRHPGLFALSTLSFVAAYLWGAFEAYWICHFLGLPVGVATALAIEMLSTSIDGIFFMVPAKAGTQEIGKTAIFAALGLPKTTGFAFGIVRHAREILWALVGLALFYLGRPAPQQSSGPAPAPAAPVNS